jgi:anti-sigma-K factor RskA
MTDQRMLDLAPISALGALDGPDHLAFQAELARSPLLRDEVRSFERTLALVSLAVEPIKPSAAARLRVLDKAPPSRARSNAAPGLSPSSTVAAAAILVLAVAAASYRARWLDARQRASAAQALSESLDQRAGRLSRDLDVARRSSEGLIEIRSLLSTPELRFASLASPAIPSARARVVYDSGSGTALLLVSGLDPPPAGKVYQAWTIAAGSPRSGGVFQVEGGSAVVWLSTVGRSDRVQAFAVSVEPKGGALAPTGPIVLMGAAS